ncbi:MAG TPA: hypothetical protein VMM15_07960 [Bradyrhizobium sp.]|nr:hypothetical protein [Bradyrhizobium sp.]
MKLLVSVDEGDNEKALEAAKQVMGRGVSRQDGLPSMVPNDVTKWVGRVWDHIEQALRDTYSQGKEAARSAIESVAAQMQAAARELGDRVADVERILRERLDSYFQTLVDAALGRLRPTIRIGSRELSATGASIQQSIKLHGSLKAKLDEICEFVAESEFEVTVSYGSAE